MTSKYEIANISDCFDLDNSFATLVVLNSVLGVIYFAVLIKSIIETKRYN